MKSAIFTAFVSFLFSATATAAKAPLSEEELVGEADYVVDGIVIRVESELEDSKVETGFGRNTDRIYTIRIRVTAIKKGDDIKEGETIIVTAWQPDDRAFFAKLGLQGHEGIPAKGNRVTLYLQEADEDGVFEPILPNGIQTHD